LAAHSPDFSHKSHNAKRNPVRGIPQRHLNLYRDKKEQFAQPLFEMTRPYDLSDPFNKVPLDLYNQMCDWLEQELGPANLR
jgi:hypothetical protein